MAIAFAIINVPGNIMSKLEAVLEFLGASLCVAVWIVAYCVFNP